MSILISGAVVGLYSITGGFGAVAFTDALQVSIMFFCGIIIVGLGISELGGFSEFSSALTKDESRSPVGVFTCGPPSVTLAWGHPRLGHRALSGLLDRKPSDLTAQLGRQSQWDASASMMFAAFAKTFVPLLIIFPGLLALVLNAPIDDSDKACHGSLKTCCRQVIWTHVRRSHRGIAIESGLKH